MDRVLALVLTVFTGFTGLVYEVTWQKLLATLLGSHSEATAAILGLFLGGLSVGYAVFGRVVRARMARAAREGTRPRLLVLYGLVEAGIGLHALAFPWLFEAAQAVSVALPHGAGGSGFAFDVALTALLIGPPTVLMGGTIPILTQALSRGIEDATRFHALVYASNTAGAFVGALAAGFLLVPWLGLGGVLRGMGLLNLAAGAAFVALGRRATAPAPASAAGATAGLPEGLALCAAAALLSGFAMMTVQTVLNRIGALSLGASQFTFAMVVAVFVLCIALGSLAVSLLPRIRPSVIVGSQWLLVAVLAGVYLQIEKAPWAAHALRSLFRDDDAGFLPFHGLAFLALLALLALPVGLSGATLPLLFHHLRREATDLGDVAGRLYSWNTVGSLLGALLGGYVLLAWLDLHDVFRVALVALALGATLLTVRVLRLPALPVVFLGFLPACVAVSWLPDWRPEALQAGLFRYREPRPETWLGPEALYRAVNQGMVIRYHDDDPVSSVAVKEYPAYTAGLARSIINNGKSDGSIPMDYATMGLVATLPALLADRNERALVIGYGTGVTAGELAALPGMERVDVAEISPAVIDAAPLFDYGNLGASKNPRVHVARTDAYRALLRSDERYDVIVSEPSNPWTTGVEMLFSEEFLAAARDRLRPGGVYAQWFHVYEIDDATVELVLRTYDAVFDHVAVWQSMGTDVILLGFEAPGRALDVERAAARFEEPAIRGALRRAGVTSFAGLLAHEVLPLGVLRSQQLEGDRHTLLRPVLSHRAARAFFAGGTARIPSAARPEPVRLAEENALLLRWLRARGRPLDESERDEIVQAACRLGRPSCATLLAHWGTATPLRAKAAEGLEQAGERYATDLEPSLRRLLALDDLPPGRVSPAEARTLSDVFARYHTPLAPFDRSILARLWARCSSAEPSRCDEGRAEAERRLGPFYERAARLEP